MMATRKSSHTGRLDSLGDLTVCMLLKTLVCIEQLEPEDNEVCTRQEKARVLYLVPRFLQYHTEREDRRKPEGEIKVTPLQETQRL